MVVPLASLLAHEEHTWGSQGGLASSFPLTLFVAPDPALREWPFEFEKGGLRRLLICAPCHRVRMGTHFPVCTTLWPMRNKAASLPAVGWSGSWRYRQVWVNLRLSTKMPYPLQPHHLPEGSANAQRHEENDICQGWGELHGPSRRACTNRLLPSYTFQPWPIANTARPSPVCACFHWAFGWVVDEPTPGLAAGHAA